VAIQKKRKDLMDIEDILDSIIATDYDPSIFSQIDDSDFKKAPNIFEWCVSPEYLGLKPYPRQLQMMLQLFEDVCVYCSDPMWKNLQKQSMVEIQDRVVFLEHGVCPKCKKNRGDMFHDGHYTYPWEMDACIGQRFGKSIMTAMASSYVLHQFLMISKPYHYFNLAPTTLHGTFTAIGFDQALDTLFTPFTDMLEESSWFKEYHKMLDFHGKKQGVEIYKSKDTFLNYGHKQLLLYPKGPDKRKMRGRTRFLYAIDEIGWFSGDGNQVTTNADEIDKALSRSMTTVRLAAKRRRTELNDYNCPMPIAFNISSPSHANDKIMRLVREGQGIPEKVVFHYSTWEAHPTITRASLESEFRSAPEESERDFGANPPIANSPFISNKEAVEESFVLQPLSSILEVRTIKTVDKNGKPCMYPEVKPLVVDKVSDFILTLDAGHTNNSFAFTLSRLGADDSTSHDILIECVPVDGHYVNFNLIHEHAIKPLLSNFGVRLVGADRWQGLKLLHDISEEFNIPFVQYSLTHADLVAYRTDLYDNKVKAPKLEDAMQVLLKPSTSYEQITRNKPALSFALQMMTVKEIGRRVEKGDGLTDDIFRAAALGHALLKDEDYAHLFKASSGNGTMNTRRSENCIIKTKLGSSGGGSRPTLSVGRTLNQSLTRKKKK